MKIIYDSENNPNTPEKPKEGSFRSQDVDITEDTFKKKSSAPKREPHSGVQQTPEVPVAPLHSQADAQNQAVAPQVPLQPYGAPVPMTQEQFNMMMAQFAAMQNGAQPVILPSGQIVYGQPAAYPVYPQGAQNIPQSQPVQTAQGEFNPGTRVLFQSEDFDKPEREEKKEAYSGPAPVFKNELHFDIDEETVELVSAAKKSSFSVDETQIEFSDSQVKKKNQPSAKEDKSKKDGKAKLPATELIRRGVLAVSVLAIVIASGMLLNEYRLSRQNNDVMEEVSDLIITEPTNSRNETPDKEEQTTQRELTPEEQWAQLKKDYPNVIFPLNLQLKYAKLYATNQDFVGYLSAPGVGLNLPVVQTSDDKKYLEKNFYKQNTKYGCPFVTHLNNITPLDQNTVIFGHHMNNGTIFGALDKYKTIDGFKKAPLITFNTLYHDYSWKVIAAFVTNAYTKDDNGYIFPYYFTQLSSYSNFASYLNELSQRSLYDTGVDVLPTDRILTLSTCSHEFTDARFVVVARLVRPGESTKVDVSKATVNQNPRYPQAWYNKKKKTNPYKNAFQWEVS